ncbi:MAG TPA: ABC transporter ATP-binding protein [Fusibacter sp.]|nr:ABC transporter ATP-binding protein [Fusibacter sp.]
MNTTILSVENVSKTIKNKEIIKGISFEINAREILGFLGPNGAGKSTTLRMIVGLSKPSSGNIFIDGHSITSDYVKAMSQVGCIIETPDMYDYMSGYKNLEMLGSMSKGVTKKSIDDAIELVGMEHRIHDKVGIYSMGMKQRLGLAQALMHKPKLLVLDEPTNGLDPQGIYEFREIIKSLVKERGISVLVSSHLISEVQLLCDKVSIINGGKIVKNASIDALLSTGQVSWTVDDVETAQRLLKQDFDIDAIIINGQLSATVNADRLTDINAAMVYSGIKIQYVSTQNRTLEDLFLSFTDHQKIL